MIPLANHSMNRASRTCHDTHIGQAPQTHAVERDISSDLRLVICTAYNDNLGQLITPPRKPPRQEKKMMRRSIIWDVTLAMMPFQLGLARFKPQLWWTIQSADDVVHSHISVACPRHHTSHILGTEARPEIDASSGIL